jgi:DNA polymerase epsilon subunit 1
VKLRSKGLPSYITLLLSLQPNHLLGFKRNYIKISFRNIKDLLNVRRMLAPVVKRNLENRGAEEAYADTMQDSADEDEQIRTGPSKKARFKEAVDYIIDIREYDVPYISRIAIDFGMLADCGLGLFLYIIVTAA